MSKSFITIFFIAALTGFLAIAAFVFSVDPYDRYGFNIYGFRTKVVAQSREAKFILFENAKDPYGAVVLGSSVGAHFHTDDIRKLTGERTFNYTVDSGTGEDYQLIARHVFSKSSPKFMFLVLTFEELNTSTTADSSLGNSKLMRFSDAKPTAVQANFDNDYITLQAANDSVKTVYMNLFGDNKYKYTPQGDVPPVEAPAKIGNWCPGMSVLPVNEQVGGRLEKMAPYEISEKRLKIFREIQRLSDEHGTRLIVLLSPMAMDCLERLDKAGGASIHQDYKNAMASVFSEVYDFQTSAIKPYSTPKNFYDSIHTSQAFAYKLLDSLFHQGSLGVRLAH